MRRAFEELRDTLAEYIEQDEHTLLVLNGTDAELGFALKALEAVEATNDLDLFFSYPLPFDGASAWVTRVASMIDAQMTATNEHRAKDRQAPLPAFPLGSCIDVRIAPEARMRTIVDYLRRLLPSERENRLVLGLTPVSVADFEGYARIVGALTPLRGAEPQTSALRLIVRDALDRALARALEARGVEVIAEDINFSPAALVHWLTVDSTDPEIEPSERMGALFQLAVMDFSARRHAEALAKLRELIPHFAREGPSAMHALSLITVGDIQRAESCEPAALRFALERYQQAIAVSIADQLWPVARNAALGAGEASLALGLAAEAESYFDSASEISKGYLDAAGTVESRTRQGDAALLGRRYAEAVTAWRDAEEVACKAKDHARRIPVLERLVSLYRDARQREPLAEAEGRLREARSHTSANGHEHASHAC